MAQQVWKVMTVSMVTYLPMILMACQGGATPASGEQALSARSSPADHLARLDTPCVVSPEEVGMVAMALPEGAASGAGDHGPAMHSAALTGADAEEPSGQPRAPARCPASVIDGLRRDLALQFEAQLMRENVAVELPNCGPKTLRWMLTDGYKTSDGTMETRLSVSQINRNVKILQAIAAKHGAVFVCSV